jgi:CHASE2 domain-containing sensor protein
MRKFLVFYLLVIALSSCNAQTQKDIVLVDVSNLDENRIAALLTKLNTSYAPAVLSVNMLFNPDDNGFSNVNLAEALDQTSQLVMAKVYKEKIDGHLWPIGGAYYPEHARSGFSNLVFENAILKTATKFEVMAKRKFSSFPGYHFAVATALSYDSAKTNNFISKHHDIVDIDFSKGQRVYERLSVDKLLSGEVPRKMVDGKIVLIGECGLDNSFFIPIIDGKTGKRVEMDGIEIIANIISQILVQ